MNPSVSKVVQGLRERLVDIMLTALEKEGGVYLSQTQRDRLFDKLDQALIGNIQL